ncbi:glycosyltransferase family 4 protein [Massilia sp. TSP1-1-2]|uniref:glycosyltransferase family 4 protein n=1 Tax=Massilia sp. TSP1-1-2 TaxID=2804649 RepID=UPI003CEC21F7
MTPLHLLFVADHLKCGGAERHLVSLATGLARRGHRVSVAYLKEHAELAGELERGSVPCVCCNSVGGLDRAALSRLRALIDLECPALLVATSQYSLMFAALARLGAPRRPALAFICHSTDVVRRGWRARSRFLVYRQFYRLAQCVVFVSEHQRHFFAALGLRLAHTEVVHNGIDLAYFSPPQKDEGTRLRQALGFGPADLVVGLCAIFREEKRHADLLAAVAHLRHEGMPVKVLLVGDGPMRARIEACRHRLRLDSAVVLAGFQADVRPFIAACDVMALTSHSETFPIATLEYMALAKPLVASDVGGMREQVEHGTNGLLFAAGDVNALAAALRRIADPPLRARLGQGALATVRARFDLHAMLARYEALFAHLQHSTLT